MRLANLDGRALVAIPGGDDRGRADRVGATGLSAVVPLLPGDIIFTGTPGGVGFTRRPPRFLHRGETLESWVEGIGTIRTRFTAAIGGHDAG
jgi:hypothetical protein